ncbi:MAG: hypothetical protein NUK65_03790 [Firmicutes bacterium]|nr:hypothetical protein [Bacillota bacterium]
MANMGDYRVHAQRQLQISKNNTVEIIAQGELLKKLNRMNLTRVCLRKRLQL